MSKRLLLAVVWLCASTAYAEAQPPHATAKTKADEGEKVAPSTADEPVANTNDRPPVPEPEIYGDQLQPDEPPGTGVASAIGVFLKTLLALGFILLLAYLTLSKGVGKLIAKSQQGKDIKVVERIGLDQRRALLLVEVDGRRLLIGTSESGMTTLADLSEDRTQRPFSDVMERHPGAASSAASHLSESSEPKGASA